MNPPLRTGRTGTTMQDTIIITCALTGAGPLSKNDACMASTTAFASALAASANVASIQAMLAWLRRTASAAASSPAIDRPFIEPTTCTDQVADCSNRL